MSKKDPASSDSSTRSPASGSASEPASAASEPAGRGHYDTIFRASADVMLVIDPTDGRIVDANHAAEAFYGHDRARLLAMSVTDINTDPPDRIRANMSRAAAGTQRFSVFKHRLASGEMRDVEVSSSRVEIEGRTLLLSIIHDMSDRIAAERAVQASQALLDRAESIAHVGSWRMTLATGEVTWSTEMARIIGVDPSRPGFTAADAIAQAVHPDDRAMLDEINSATLHDGVPRPADYRIVHADGTVRWIHAEGVQEFDDSGRIVALVGFVQDITRQKEAEEALRARETALREAQRIGRTGSWTWDPVADTATWSEQIYRMYGLDQGSPATNFAGLDTLFTPESTDLARRAVGRAVQDGEPFEFEAEFIRPDGSHGWTLHRGVPDRDPDGSVVAFHGTDTDISDRKRAENDLRRSEATYRTLLGQSPTPIAAIRAGRGVYANEAHMRLFGYSSFEELAEFDIDDMAAPESRELVRERVRRRSLGLPAESEYEFVGLRRDGSTFPAKVKTAPIELPDGPATLVFHIDLTEARLASEALRASEEKFEKAFQAAPLLISLTDLSTGLWVDVNEEALRLSGFSRDEVVGHSAVEIGWITPENRDRLLDELRAGGRIAELEMDFRTRDGRMITGLVSGELISVLGCDCLLTVTVDITERRRAEAERERLQAELAQSQKMEAVGRLAGGIAHDFNNLLTAIGGYARILESDLMSGSGDPEDAAEIRRAADRAAALTAKLLAFSGRHSAEPVTIDLAAAVAQILPMLRRIVPERIEIATELAPGPPIEGDPAELDQVIVNLVANAADAMAGIGIVTVGTGVVDHDEHFVRSHLNARPGAHVRLSVTDTGSGISDTDRARIFEPFFTTKEVGQGTGLGLATVYGVVERMGGTIEVRSAPGKGTAFEIDFPASGSSVVPAAVPPEPPARRGAELILLVEDDSMVRKFATAALLRLGYRVTAVESPADGARIPASEYDLLITDVVMPGMVGTELVRTLRQTRPDLPVLFVSGYSQGTVSQDELDEPRTALLSKPFTPVELADAARRLLDEAPEA